MFLIGHDVRRDLVKEKGRLKRLGSDVTFGVVNEMKSKLAIQLVIGILALSIGGGCAPSWISVPDGVIATEAVTIASIDGSWKISSNTRFHPPFYSNDCPDTPTTDNYAEGEGWGASRVMVWYPGFTEPLFGLLSLCKVSPYYKGAASRSYQIDVPKQYIDATDGGRISVVYEQYPWAAGRNLPAWILWLSRTPFSGR
jgi:hypothetical protein